MEVKSQFYTLATLIQLPVPMLERRLNGTRAGFDPMKRRQISVCPCWELNSDSPVNSLFILTEFFRCVLITMKPISCPSCGTMDLNSEYLNCAKCKEEITVFRSYKINIREKTLQ
jgi:hypothetical protein